jgi:hypothetical protein
LYSLATVNKEVSLCLISSQVVTAVNIYMYIIPTIGLYFTENTVFIYSNSVSTIAEQERRKSLFFIEVHPVVFCNNIVIYSLNKHNIYC